MGKAGYAVLIIENYSTDIYNTYIPIIPMHSHDLS
jgi:hypothetical protein